MDMTVNLRPFADNDSELFSRWINKPHVFRWFSHREAWLYEIEHRHNEFSFVHHFIAQCDGADMGFCQYYDYALGGEDWHGNADVSGAYSIDYLIGEEQYLGLHHAPKLIHALEERIAWETDAKLIIVQPERENDVSRRTLLSAGYAYDEENDIFVKRTAGLKLDYVDLRQRPELMEKAASFFSSKWSVPQEAYEECMTAYLRGETEYGWHLCLDGNRIVAGLGVVDNDFHERKDLTPNICAVYTEAEYRSRGIAGRILNAAVADLRRRGISPVYLITDHDGFYERYDWEYLCPVLCDSSETSRIYVHR